MDGQPALGVPSEEDIQRVSQLRPRTVLYFFSGGKDSALALSAYEGLHEGLLREEWL